MTTNQKVWGKTILSSYNYLEKLCDSLDYLIQKTAVNSYHTYGFKNGENSIMNISNKIINLSNRKIDYINLKVLTDKVLKIMQPKQAKLLILKYINKINADKLCELLNVNVRTVYRRLDSALQEFMEKLSIYGYTIEKLEVNYAQDSFIKSVLKLIAKNKFLLEEKADVITNDSVFNKYINELMACTN